MARNWQDIFQDGQGLSKRAISQLSGIEVDLATALAFANGGSQPLQASVYGVKADGVTDDTAAWLALAAAADNGSTSEGNGATIQCPRGITIVSAPIVFGGLGVKLIGHSGYASVFKAASGFSGEAMLKFKNADGASINTGHTIEDLRVDCNGQSCHGVKLYKGYDLIYWKNVDIVNVADAFSAARLVPDPGIVNQVSQTVLWDQVLGSHKNDTATAPTFFFDTVQEAVFNGCKGWGGVSGGSTATAVPWYFQDCRGVAMFGCSGASTASEAIHVSTVTRPSVGFYFAGMTFESVGTILSVAGADSTNTVSQVTLEPFRTEQSVGGITLTNCTNSDLWTRAQAVTVDATCSQVRIFSTDITQVTDNGTNTTVLGWANALTGGQNFKVSPHLAIENTNTPAMQLRVPGLASRWVAEWSANSGGGDFGLRISRYSTETSRADYMVFVSSQAQAQVDLCVSVAGKGLRVKEGSNAKQGVATLVAGTVTVSNTSVTANSRIVLTAQDNNTTGALRVSARTAGTSFAITSSNAADTGVVAYQIFEPA